MFDHERGKGPGKLKEEAYKWFVGKPRHEILVVLDTHGTGQNKSLYGMWHSLNISLDVAVKRYEMLTHRCGKAGSF